MQQDNASQAAASLDDLTTVEELVRSYPAVLTERAVRWHLRQRHDNGLAETGAVIPVGRRLLINRPLYGSWLANRGRG